MLKFLLLAKCENRILSSAYSIVDCHWHIPHVQIVRSLDGGDTLNFPIGQIVELFVYYLKIPQECPKHRILFVDTLNYQWDYHVVTKCSLNHSGLSPNISYSLQINLDFDRFLAVKGQKITVGNPIYPPCPVLSDCSWAFPCINVIVNRLTFGFELLDQ